MDFKNKNKNKKPPKKQPSKRVTTFSFSFHNSDSPICSSLCQTHFVKCKVGSVKEKKSWIYKVQSLHNLDSPLPLDSGDRTNGKQSQTKHFRCNLAS